MKKMSESLGLCPVCRKGHLHAAERVRAFNPHGELLEVKLQTSCCDACGEMTTKASQQKENLRTLAARKEHYGKLLMGEEILALRKRYGLTQQNASLIFGKGKIAFSRYESETTYPDESTTLLLTIAIEKPDVMKALADKAEVTLPLWAERCEDAQRVKLSFIRGLPSMPVLREGVLQATVGAAHIRPAQLRMIGNPTQRVMLMSNEPASNEAEVLLEAFAS